MISKSPGHEEWCWCEPCTLIVLQEQELLAKPRQSREFITPVHARKGRALPKRPKGTAKHQEQNRDNRWAD